MNDPMYRYYKTREAVLACESVTPMFLGNADQEAEWRAAPFKSLFRYWWRLTQGGCSPNELLKSEGKIFGIAGDENDSGKSALTIHVVSDASATKAKFKAAKIKHPECRSPVDPLKYLGMGIFDFKSGLPIHSYFPAGSKFELQIRYPSKKEQEIKNTLSFINAFGAVGARCRNGWGCFEIAGAKNLEFEPEEPSKTLDKQTILWKEGLKNDKDYPNCLGKDEDPLLWKTKQVATWELAMKLLAEAYIGVRAGHIEDIPKLNPNGKDYPDERHLLGFPLTNHNAFKGKNWGKNARHASPLRLIVHKANGGYRGFILHLPFLHSTEMELPPHIDQVAVWEKVHKKLDAISILQRATYKECLS